MRSPLAFLVVLVVGLAGLAYAARTTPTTDPAVATITTLGGVQESDGWCVDVAVGAPVDLMASIPARISATERGKIRHLVVSHADDTDSTADVCVRMADSTGLDCSTVAGMAGRLSNAGESLGFVVPIDSALAQPPALYADSNGATVTTCVDVAW